MLSNTLKSDVSKCHTFPVVMRTWLPVASNVKLNARKKAGGHVFVNEWKKLKLKINKIQHAALARTYNNLTVAGWWD